MKSNQLIRLHKMYEIFYFHENSCPPLAFTISVSMTNIKKIIRTKVIDK